MKIAKYFFASFLLLAITTAFATKSHAQTTKYFEYTGSGGFTISSGTHSQLTTAANWTQRTAGTLPTCTGTGKICYFSVTYTCNGSSDPNINNCPSDQDLFNALDSKYNVNTPNPNTFTFDPAPPSNTITVNNVGPNGGVTVVFTLVEKS